MTKVNVYVDNLKVCNNQIIAYAIVNKKDIDFYIGKAEFETFVDENELREWEEPIPSWADIYSGYQILQKFLELYIQNLYLLDEIDIEIPVKKILKTAI
jgi:hypothetical protein